MKTNPLLFTLFAFSFLVVEAFSQAQFAERFMKLDQDKDGKISKAEAEERPLFGRLDANKDGFVEKAEVEKAVAAWKKRPRGGKAKAVPKLPEGVKLTSDVAYREGNPKWTLDVYVPEAEAPEGGRPGIVVVHGGGWRGGDKVGGVWSRVPAEYAAKGYVAISVNYRLFPEVGMLDCIADVKCAVRWLRANAETYGVDPDRLGAFGNSAGAHLVSMLGLTEASDGLEGDGPHQAFSSQVQAVCAAATPTDFLNWGKESKRKKAGDFPPLAEGEGTPEERGTKASPVTHASADAPPFLLFHAENDGTVPYDQGVRLRDALKKAEAKNVTFMGFEDGGHGVFGAKAPKTGPAMAAFFEKALAK